MTDDGMAVVTDHHHQHQTDDNHDDHDDPRHGENMDMETERTFVLVVKIKGVRGMESLTTSSFVWLSYEFLGCVVQSDLFEPTRRCTNTNTNTNMNTNTACSTRSATNTSSSFISSPQQDDFRIEGSTWSEVIKLLEENELEIYVCSESCIHGEARLSLNHVLNMKEHEMPPWPSDDDDGDGTRYGRVVDVDVTVDVNPLETSDNNNNEVDEGQLKSSDTPPPPTLHLSIQLKMLPAPSSSNQQREVELLNVVCDDEDDHEINNRPSLLPQHSHVKMEDDYNMNKNTTTITTTGADEGGKAKIMELRAQLEQEKEEWTIHKQREEEAFRRHLRTKEDAVRRFLERQVRKNEEEHAKELELCRDKYKHLELRLKKALSEVEAKEREMKRTLDEGQALYAKKIVEVELEAKRVQSDVLNHSETKAAKLDALTDQVKVLEKALDSANARATKAEGELEQLKVAANDKQAVKVVSSNLSPPSDRREEMKELRRRLEMEVAAKNNAMQEREHYRLAAHRLAKMVREERKNHRRARPPERKPSSPVVHNRGRSSQIHLCDNNQAALRRIKEELSSLQETNVENRNNFM